MLALHADLPVSIDVFRYYAGWADKLHGKTIPVNGDYFRWVATSLLRGLLSTLVRRYDILMFYYYCYGATVIVQLYSS